MEKYSRIFYDHEHNSEAEGYAQKVILKTSDCDKPPVLKDILDDNVILKHRKI